ncbi:2-amino-4-hydroxy-6-hydroxymethyldihydropteridine diphosphokinase [Ignavigranum ruoffiae]|uniref:2-amino-4-hydroxy-6- hydroxymethyldihydropteridine diphosphokinase n=1 Tax=Ignavigranum ruoffiae TaxID=89093 RepID=UPI0024ADF236|nr:2-amino-4-hydroxy-6-hydroxymethyldihydropteridine diphosphokinase [Ignavigranum ruoffiae]
MDQLIIKDLEVYAYHGLFQSEKDLGQKFYLTLALSYDMSQAAIQEDLDQSIDYGKLCQQLTQWMQETSYDFIETVAYRLCQKILDLYPLVSAVELELAKPSAPVPLPLNTCAVRVKRQRHRAYIALGSNQGDRQAYLDQALRAMADQGLKVIQASSQIKTPAWGKTDQPDFLNQVVEVETTETADYLLTILQSIENESGRIRTEHWGSRTLDLDLLFYDQEQIYTDRLIVPHPYIQERLFVLEPLNEIAPHWLHPVLKQSVKQLYHQLKGNE